jgi:hypothetical protein
MPHDRSTQAAAPCCPGIPRYGWPVLPVIPGGKAPVTRHGCSEGSTDPRQIADWRSRNPARNVAIVASAPGPDVLDIDVQDGTRYPALCQLKREGLVPDPLVVVSTPSGGLHLYFRW